MVFQSLIQSLKHLNSMLGFLGDKETATERRGQFLPNKDKAYIVKMQKEFAQRNPALDKHWAIEFWGDIDKDVLLRLIAAAYLEPCLVRSQRGVYEPGFRLVEIAGRVKSRKGRKQGGGIGTGELPGEQSEDEMQIDEDVELGPHGSEEAGFLEEVEGGYSSHNPLIALVKGMAGGRDRLLNNDAYRVLNDYDFFSKFLSRHRAQELGMTESEDMGRVREEMKAEVLSCGISQYDFDLQSLLTLKCSETVGDRFQYHSGDALEERHLDAIMQALGEKTPPVWFRQDRVSAGSTMLQEVMLMCVCVCARGCARVPCLVCGCVGVHCRCRV